MINLYVACELGVEDGGISLGALQKEGLIVSDAGQFHGLTTVQDGSVVWDISSLYHQVLRATQGIAAQEEPIRGISFHSGITEALLFGSDGSVMTPATRASQTAVDGEFKKLLAKLNPEAIYEETGIQPSSQSMLCQLATEPSRRLKRAGHALSLPDGFNFLMSGVARAEMSLAHGSQAYSPVANTWSEHLLKAAGVPARILPSVIPAGTVLGPVRPDIAPEAGLEDARVVATCSHELAAALSALSIADPENWAFLRPDLSSLVGTRLEAPSINEVSREMGYSNLTAYGGVTGFYKQWVGLQLVEACRRTWSQQDRALDSDVLLHLATSATPFEAFIDPADPRFLAADDMPQAIQSFCRDTGQEAPRKPGPILRCILESLALQYRKSLLELEYITGATFSRLYVLGGQSSLLLNHFLANALQIPVVVVPPNLAAVGNIAVQALALGHIPSLDLARELVNHALKVQTIHPHAAAWVEAFDRFLDLRPAPLSEQTAGSIPPE